MKNSIFSLIIYSDFGFFKKPDANISYLTYEYIPKPALLGLLGSIIGLKGYTKNTQIPEFYQKLESLKTGIQPLELANHSLPIVSSDFLPLREPFLKTFVKYNNYHGYGSYEPGGNLIITEQILIRPAFRIYFRCGEVHKDIFEKLKGNLENQRSHYVPYMGKNDFPASFIYEGEFTYRSSREKNIKICTLFFTDVISKIGTMLLEDETFYKIYHNYPYCIENQQYKYKKAIYSDARFHIDKNELDKNKYELCEINERNIFLF